MSIQSVAWVLSHSESRGFARLVLISLANHHNGGTGQCNPGQRTIAEEAGISPGSVGPNIAKLVALGEVEIVDPGTSHRSAEYVLTFAQQLSVERGSTRGLRADEGQLRAGNGKVRAAQAAQNLEPGTINRAPASQEKRKIAAALALPAPVVESPDVDMHHADPDERERVRAGPLGDIRERLGLSRSREEPADGDQRV